MRPDELIAAFLVDPARGPQQFSKVGTRNAMVIAVCSLALVVDPKQKHVGIGIGSAGPTPIRATEAEAFIEEVVAHCVSDFPGRAYIQGAPVLPKPNVE